MTAALATVARRTQARVGEGRLTIVAFSHGVDHSLASVPLVPSSAFPRLGEDSRYVVLYKYGDHAGYGSGTRAIRWRMVRSVAQPSLDPGSARSSSGSFLLAPFIHK